MEDDDDNYVYYYFDEKLTSWDCLWANPIPSLPKRKIWKNAYQKEKKKIKFKEYYQLGLFVGKLGKLGEFPSLLSSPAPAQKLNVKSAPVKFPIFNHMPIRDICPFFSTNTIFGLIFLHAKTRKLWQNWFRDKTA